MKKILIAIVIFFGVFNLVPNVLNDDFIEARAVKKAIPNNIKTSLKKGSLPKAKMKLGTTYIKALSIVKKRQWSDYVGFYPKGTDSFDGTPGYFFDAWGTADLTAKSKVVAIAADYNYYFTDSSIKKIGKIKKKLNYDTTVTTLHKVGKYHVVIRRNKLYDFTSISVEYANAKYKNLSQSPMFFY